MKIGIPSPVPVVGADHLVPRQENNRQAQQNLNILSTHYVAPKAHQELLGLQLRDRQSDIYGHVFGANSSGNDDCRRRVGNAHAALLHTLDRPDLRQVRDSLTRRFEQLEQAATSGNAIRNDLAKISSRGQATKFAVTKLIQGAAVMETSVELDVGINWRLKVKPRDGSEVVRHDAALGRSLHSRAFENLPMAFAGAYVATQGLSLAHDWLQPAYFTSIGAKRRDLAAAAEEFRANSERAAHLRAGGQAAQAIVETYGERGRDFLESTMNEVDRSAYAYMQALQRQVPRAMPPDDQFAMTGVTSASQQVTYARLEEARFINTFTDLGPNLGAVVEAWRPTEELPGAGVLLRAKVLPRESLQSATRVRHDRSAEDRSSAEADPPRWDYQMDLSAALAELGSTAGNISGWGDYMRVQRDLPLARNGNAAALARLGDLCENGRAGKDSGPPANRVAQSLYKASAAGGDPQGQYRLGLMHARGHASGPGGGRGDAMAEHWLTQAAQQGNPAAQAELGILHASGRTGLPPHSAAIQGRRWCNKAVVAGVRSAELFFTLGRLHEEGRAGGVSEERHMKLCKTWYTEAALEGHAPSQRQLGLLHLDGKLGLQNGRGDDAAAAHYLRLAADQNDAIAAWHLAEMYREERVKPTDSEGPAHEETMRYLTLAADAGHAPAQFALGASHARGQAGAGPSEPDHAQAARRYREAAAQGHMKAQFELTKLLLIDDVEELIPPAGGQGRRAEALHWCRLAAEQGSVGAQVTLANLHEAGLAGIKPGPAANLKMAEWLARAAEQGDPNLQYRLAEHYAKGTAGLETGDQGLRIAVKWYERAAAQGHPRAQYWLGTLHAQGKAGLAAGVVADAQAVALLTRAAEAGHAPAMLGLARMYAQGRAAAPTGQEPGAMAAKWYASAGALGERQALYELGRMHEQGRTGLDAEAAQNAALESYCQAAELGHEPALQRVTELERSAAARAAQADKTEHRTGTAGPTEPVVQEPAHAPPQPPQVHQGSDAQPEGTAAPTPADESAEVLSRKTAQAKFAKGKTLAENSKDPAEVHKGYRLMEEAASQGGPALQYQLADLYIKGAGDGPMGPRRAMKTSALLTLAADQGHQEAMKAVANLYLKEQYVDSTTKRAVTGPAAYKAAEGYLEKCAELGDHQSMANLGWMHETGRAGPEPGRPDRGKAREYYRKAAAAGSDYARKKLGDE